MKKLPRLIPLCFLVLFALAACVEKTPEVAKQELSQTIEKQVANLSVSAQSTLFDGKGVKGYEVYSVEPIIGTTLSRLIVIRRSDTHVFQALVDSGTKFKDGDEVQPVTLSLKVSSDDRAPQTIVTFVPGKPR
jgi:hypothetical protein